MAGIYVRVAKQERFVVLPDAENQVLKVLTIDDSQKFGSIALDNVWLVSVAKINQPLEEVYFYDEELEVVVALDGFCRICSDYHAYVSANIDSSSQSSHLKGIAELVKKYGSTWHTMIEGSYNLAVYDIRHEQLAVCNDVLGFYPLYHNESMDFIAFSSRLEALISAHKSLHEQVDFVSIAEHILFKYIVSDRSYLLDSSVLPGASLVTVKNGKKSSTQFWSIDSIMHGPALDRDSSFSLLNSSLKSSCLKILEMCKGNINMSLTGGWDSRVVLSYYLGNNKRQLGLYSFGAHGAPDVLVPQQISQSEELSYTPIILTKEYLDKEFMSAAHRTIVLSDGTRNYKRSHYLYAIEKVSKKSIHVITGIFGDQIMKTGKPSGSTVVSRSIINLIDKGFVMDKDLLYKINYVSTIVSGLNRETRQGIEAALFDRIAEIGKEFKQYGKRSNQYFVFQFTKNLRRYFGNEAASYRDYVHCHSPFIDKHFLADYAKTSYAGFRHPYVSTNLLEKVHSTRLYARLIASNHSPLLDYPSGRGYNMRDALSYKGYYRIFKTRKSSKKYMDAYNTNPARTLFIEQTKKYKADLELIRYEQGYEDDVCSLVYWMEYLSREYSQ